MKKWMPLLAVAVLVLASLACKTVTSTFLEPTPTPLPPTAVPTPTALPEPTATPDLCPNGDCISACLGDLQAIVKTGDASGGQSHSTLRKKSDADGQYLLVTYFLKGGETLGDPQYGAGVPKSLEPAQKNREAHQQIWNFFTSVIPLEQRGFLSEYIIFTDGESNILASVSLTDRSPQKWRLNVDIQDATDPRDLTYTLVHEFGHLLTLNPEQVPPSDAIFNDPSNDDIYTQEAEACPNYFPGEGCSVPESYINLFVNRFWGELFEDWQYVNDSTTDDEYYDRYWDFYDKYQDQFVTDYAPTSPEEDIAESFTHFVLMPKPAGNSIAEEKVLFFYEFPELVQLRAQMGLNLCAQLEK